MVVVLVTIKVVGSVINNQTGMGILPVLGFLVALQEDMVGLEEDSEVTLKEKVLVGTTIVTPSVHDIDSPGPSGKVFFVAFNVLIV